jgi:PAS domain-containing protein
MTDRAGLITYANDNFIDISGYSNEELIGKNHRILNSVIIALNFLMRFGRLFLVVIFGKEKSAIKQKMA